MITGGSVRDNDQSGLRLDTDLAVVTGTAISGNGGYAIQGPGGLGFPTVADNAGAGNEDTASASLGRGRRRVERRPGFPSAPAAVRWRRVLR